MEYHKDKEMQSSKGIFPLTMSHVLIKIPKEEHEKIFVQKFITFFVKKIVRMNKKREVIFEASKLG